MPKEKRLVTNFKSSYAPQIKIITYFPPSKPTAADVGSSSNQYAFSADRTSVSFTGNEETGLGVVNPSTFIRCDDLNVSLAMRFRLREVGMSACSPPSSTQPKHAVSIGIAYCPDFLQQQAVHSHVGKTYFSRVIIDSYASRSFRSAGEFPNSWGLIYKAHPQIDPEVPVTPDTCIASCGSILSTIAPLKICGQFDASDEVRIDVSFKRSAVFLIVNNVVLHEFTLKVTVPHDSPITSVALEDFVVGCVVGTGVEAQISSERLSIRDNRERLERAIFQQERVQEELINAGLAEGIQFRGKPKLMLAQSLRQSNVSCDYLQCTIFLRCYHS